VVELPEKWNVVFIGLWECHLTALTLTLNAWIDDDNNTNMLLIDDASNAQPSTIL